MIQLITASTEQWQRNWRRTDACPPKILLLIVRLGHHQDLLRAAASLGATLFGEEGLRIGLLLMSEISLPVLLFSFEQEDLEPQGSSGAIWTNRRLSINIVHCLKCHINSCESPQQSIALHQQMHRLTRCGHFGKAALMRPIIGEGLAAPEHQTHGLIGNSEIQCNLQALAARQVSSPWQFAVCNALDLANSIGDNIHSTP